MDLIQDMDRLMKKELFINDKNETHIDYLLSGILRQSRYPWFYERYTNLCIPKDSFFLIDFIDVVQMECDCFYHTKTIATLQEVENENELREIVIQFVNENYYIVIWIDEYFIPGTACFNSYHRIHPIFIYGYADQENSFIFLQSSPTKGTVKLVSDFGCLYTAFMSLQKMSTEVVDASVFSIVGHAERKTSLNWTFGLQRYLSGLRNYILSECKYSEYIVGLNIYDCFINAIQSDTKITFKSVYTLYVHKEFMSDRFSYIANKYKLTDTCVECMKEYEGIIRLSRQAVFLNIKYSMKEDLYEGNFSKNIDFKKKMIQILEEVRDKETVLLNNIYEELKILSG